MNKKNGILLGAGIVVAVAMLSVALLKFSAPEDGWKCRDGKWIKQGNPSVPMPEIECAGGPDNQVKVPVPTQDVSKQIDSPNTQIANPASKSCVDKGGKLDIRTAADGGQIGICNLPDGRQCEEWEFFRSGKCEGIK